jgi:hypothetical protein
MKKNTAVKSPIGASLEKQLILPLCTAVFESFNKNGCNPVEFTKSSDCTKDHAKPWLDGDLFKEAMRDLLTEAIRSREGKEPVKFSLSAGGTSSWQVMVSYLLCQSADERFDDTSGYPYFLSDRTRDIISQHRAKMSFKKDKKKINFLISFER